MNKRDGEEILDQLLSGINRTVTREQKNYILEMFVKSGCSPLFVRIVFEEIRNWKSFHLDFKDKLKHNIIDSVSLFIENLSKIYHHNKILVERVLGYLECSRNGLSEKEILLETLK